MIRFYQRDDLAAITAIYAHHVRHGTASFEEIPPSEDEMARRFDLLAGDGMPLFVDVDEQGNIRGYAYAGLYNRRSAYRFAAEDSIYVQAGLQRQGVGRALLTALINHCQQAGFLQMMAVIGDSGNIGSIGLHETMGFRRIGVAEKIGFKFDRWLDVVYMQRDLRLPIE
jgi:L-amino acid N-acyltransferase YncA